MRFYNNLVVLIVMIVMSVSISSCKGKQEPPYYESSRKGSAEPPVKEVPKDILAAQQAFANVVKAVNPAVVNISTVSKKRLIQPFFEFSPFFNDFFGDGQRPQYRREKSLGSGFIINGDGYIITNDHVVRDAESIRVKLSNEKVYDGIVVGSDQKTDIAVIKINAGEHLKTAVLGDSDKLQVGQWAIAIGNPFGLDRTVTVGVVSATGRSNMGIETYEDFIQTDASINPGNSGGPLLNVYGEVIGINTAIVAAGQGIGFAIPVNMAKQVVEQLIKKGSVTRGWLGVSIQPVTEEIARAFSLNRVQGALISDIIPGSPAEKAGLKQGDIILRFGGKDVKDSRQLQLLVAEETVGKNVALDIFRDGKPAKLQVTLGNQESEAAAKPGSAEPRSGWLGMTVEELPDNMRMNGLSGVLVTDLEPDGVAGDAGIRRGDIIIAINRKKIVGLRDYASAMSEAEKRGTLAILVKRDGANIYFALKIR
jgi:serine protease Do